MAKWEPKGTIEEFRERLLEHRGKGKTWRAIALQEGTNKSTLYEWFAQNPEIKSEIKKNEKEEQKDNIHQTLLEVALKDKNVTALIYLAKAKLKMWDTPKAAAEDPSDKPKEELHPPMTRDQWKKLHEERLAKKSKEGK